VIRSVRLVGSARDDVARLVAFLAERNPRAASEAAMAISHALLSLNEFAERGHPARREGFRELVVRYGRDGYVIRYRVLDQSVIVLRVYHGKQDR
jgi:plasmid stabilization system protein ParE